MGQRSLPAVPAHQGERTFEDEFALRVARARGQFSTNDERITAHVRDQLQSVAFHTSDSLAAETGVSRAAIVRFARKLGFAGFTEFRDAARGSIQQVHESPLGRFAEGQEVSLLDRKVQQDTSNLVATRTLVQDIVEQAAQTIAHAERVKVIASRKSFGLAMYFQRMLGQVRSDVHLVEPGFPDELANLTERDVVVACLFRRYSRQTISLLDAARTAGARTIVVTDGRNKDFIREADLVLAAVADSPTLYDSMVAPVWLLEAVVAETATVDRGRSRESLEATERFARSQGLLFD